MVHRILMWILGIGAFDLSDKGFGTVDRQGDVSLGVTPLLANLPHAVDDVFVELRLHEKMR